MLKTKAKLYEEYRAKWKPIYEEYEAKLKKMMVE